MSESQHFRLPKIRAVPAGLPFSWLRRGFGDMRANPLASVFYGSCFAGMGILLHAVFSHAVEYISALAMGFVLVGPFLAIGLYDLSRQREEGRRPVLGPSLVAWRANLGATGIYVLILTVIFLVWARASLVIFALFYTQPMPTMAGFIGQVLSAGNVNFLVVYFGVGMGFAALAFALSVVSVPYLLDGNADAVTAAAASVLALVRNLRAMLVWALLIVALIGAGLATFYLGLILTVPLIGHATWHAYRDLVATREAAPDS
jgi:uncharacterized membrane protein